MACKDILSLGFDETLLKEQSSLSYRAFHHLASKTIYSLDTKEDVDFGVVLPLKVPVKLGIQAHDKERLDYENETQEKLQQQIDYSFLKEIYSKHANQSVIEAWYKCVSTLGPGLRVVDEAVSKAGSSLLTWAPHLVWVNPLLQATSCNITKIQIKQTNSAVTEHDCNDLGIPSRVSSSEQYPSIVPVNFDPTLGDTLVTINFDNVPPIQRFFEKLILPKYEVLSGTLVLQGRNSVPGVNGEVYLLVKRTRNAISAFRGAWRSGFDQFTELCKITTSGQVTIEQVQPFSLNCLEDEDVTFAVVATCNLYDSAGQSVPPKQIILQGMHVSDWMALTHQFRHTITLVPEKDADIAVELNVRRRP